MSPSELVPWPEFSQDPRRPESSALRASDRDRDVVVRVLGDGYADGRLTREEYDERSNAAAAARTLGDLAPIIADLVPKTTTRSAEDPHTRAVKAYEASRRRALSGMVMPSVITFVIWFATGFAGKADWNPHFPWPLFVVLVTGLNLLRVLLHKQDLIEEEEHRLVRKQQKKIDPPK
jgi:Domain of unknown function (DUF1707)